MPQRTAAGDGTDADVECGSRCPVSPVRALAWPWVSSTDELPHTLHCWATVVIAGAGPRSARLAQLCGTGA